MTEIILNNITLFDIGFILKTNTNLQIGTTYELTITDSVSTTITKSYTPSKNNNIIIDNWGSTVPNDGTVCFTLNDLVSSCVPFTCTLVVN